MNRTIFRKTIQSTMDKAKTIILFDVDGTLTVPRNTATDEMKLILKELRTAGYAIGIVGGSDFQKQQEQMGNDVLSQFDYVFAENGLRAFHDGQEFHKQSLVQRLGNAKIKTFVKYILRMIADLDIPVQRGTFIEMRNGMFNISPIGRNCSQEERDEFEKYDKEHHVREGMIKKLSEQFPDYGFQYSIGGQISFDVFPIGWDKTYCLQFVKDKYPDVHFFGDKTHKGGNDYEIFVSDQTTGHHVNTYKETIAILKKDFL